MATQNNQHMLMKNWEAILTISSVLIIRVRYLRRIELRKELYFTEVEILHTSAKG